MCIYHLGLLISEKNAHENVDGTVDSNESNELGNEVRIIATRNAMEVTIRLVASIRTTSNDINDLDVVMQRKRLECPL